MGVSANEIRRERQALSELARRERNSEQRRLEEEALAEYVEASLSIRYSEGTVKGVRLG
jgi:hypothetical protein